MAFIPDVNWDKNRWQRLIARKEASAYLEQRKALLLGVDPIQGTCISLPREVIDSGHYHASGRTGAGKSQTSLLALALQLIRGFRRNDGSWSRKAPVIFLDLKGDNAVFHALKRGAELDGRVFRFLSTRPNEGYYFFDPFQCFPVSLSTPIDQASDWTRSFGLDNGMEYAKKWFADNNIVLLKDAIKEMQQLDGPASLGVLLDILSRLATQPGRKDATHIKLCVEMLAEYPQLNEDLHEDKPYPRIDVTEAIRQGDVLYFLLPCLRGGSSVRQIAALVLSTIIQAAEKFRAVGEDTGPIYVFIDEFYHIAGKAFGDLLSMSREWDLHFILANQTHAQLKAHDPDLPAIVRANTNVEQMFSAEDIDEIRFLQEGSGQTPHLDTKITLSDRGNSESYSLRDDWSLDWTTIQRVNDMANWCFVKFLDGKPWDPGMRIKIVQALYPLSKLDYGCFRLAPIPSTPTHQLKQPTGFAKPIQPDVPPSDNEDYRQRKFTVAEQTFQDKLAAKFAELSALDSNALGA